MAPSTITITFQSKDIGEDVPLMLCFSPPSLDLFIKTWPVVWKSTTLASTGRSFLKVKWSDTFALVAPQPGSDKVVAAGNYIPIERGQQSDFAVIDNTKEDPTFDWTDPVGTTGDAPYVQGNNQTGRTVKLGLDVITHVNTDDDSVSTVLTSPEVRADTSVKTSFAPILSAYVHTPYKAGEIVKSDITKDNLVWRHNLADLSTEIVVDIKKTLSGAIVADVAEVGMADEHCDVESDQSQLPLGRFLSQSAAARVYRATLAFKTVDTVAAIVPSLTKALVAKNYIVKITADIIETDATFELALPPHISFAQAESDLLDSLAPHINASYGSTDEADTDTDIALAPTAPGPATVRVRAGSGAFAIETAESFSFWQSVTPASADWLLANAAEDIDERN